MGMRFKQGVARVWMIGALTLGAIATSGCSSNNGNVSSSAPSPTWYHGTEANESEGNIGDYFLDTDDMVIYIKTEKGWESQGSLKGKDGKDGLNGSDGAPGKDGTNGSDGAPGKDGLNGSDGAPGENGKNGASWWSGTAIEGKGNGIEADVEGAKIGDFYLNTATGGIYRCIDAGKWEYLMGIGNVDAKQEWDEDKTLKVLSIGNSFSVDSQQWLAQIAKSMGVKRVVLGNLYIGGCTLATHLSNFENDASSYTYYTTATGTWTEQENYQIDTAALSENWDYITFQQASGYSGLPATYDDLTKLIDYIEPLCPKAKLVWNMTWAYQQGSTHVDFPNYDNDQMTMYEAIVASVKEKIEPNESIDRIIPVGTAIQNARTSYLGDTLNRDGFHLSYGLGRYIAGLCFAYSLTGLSFDGIEYKADGVSEGEKAVAIESVKNAFTSPYEVTASSIKEDPEKIDESKYDRLALNWTSGAFYNSNTDTQSLIADDSISNRFWATQILSKDDLPEGSIICLSPNYQYRPEGWVSGKKGSARPDQVASSKVEVTSSWWGEYDQRAFNVSKVTNDDLTGLSEDTMNEIFKIYVPKNEG
jgi:hypothetical protein